MWIWAIALLWSINERLGSGGAAAGRDFEEPGQEWIDDLLTLDTQDREQQRRDRRAAKGMDDDDLFEH